jgi:hypothetical protein
MNCVEYILKANMELGLGRPTILQTLAHLPETLLLAYLGSHPLSLCFMYHIISLILWTMTSQDIGIMD